MKDSYENKTLDNKFDRILVTKDFVESNKLSLCRTEEEIIKYSEDFCDFFGGIRDVLGNYLSHEKLKLWVGDEYISKVESKEIILPDPITDIYETTQDFLDYMRFAWGKAIDEKELSASRSVCKLSAWMWLLNREDISKIIRDDALYNPYGSRALIEAYNMLSIEVPQELIEFSKRRC